MGNRVGGKVALITGGGSGLGEATCKRLAEEGATVVITDIKEDNAKRVASEINESGGHAVFKFQDVVSENQWKEIISEVCTKFGKLDVLVNNAGISIIENVEEASLKNWQKIQRVNLDAVFIGTREAIKVMKAKGGSIINISSIEGLIGDPELAAYNASKGGVRIFSKSAALHCAAEGYAIRVNTVHPGFIDTPLIHSSISELSEAAAEEFWKNFMAAIPVGKMGQPVDIANGVLFLASDESRYMTGAELVIDGGYTAK